MMYMMVHTLYICTLVMFKKKNHTDMWLAMRWRMAAKVLCRSFLGSQKNVFFHVHNLHLLQISMLRLWPLSRVLAPRTTGALSGKWLTWLMIVSILIVFSWIFFSGTGINYSAYVIHVLFCGFSEYVGNKTLLKMISYIYGNCRQYHLLLQHEQILY